MAIALIKVNTFASTMKSAQRQSCRDGVGTLEYDGTLEELPFYVRHTGEDDLVRNNLGRTIISHNDNTQA